MKSVIETPWLTTVQPRPNADARLFCFPYAGGGASVFHTWPTEIRATIEICSVQLPGRQDRIKEAPFTQFSLLVQAVSQALSPYLDKPFAFFGHSMGGPLSFEVARQLRRQGASIPVYLFVSGCGAPQIPSPHPPLHALPDAEFIKELRLLNGLPDAVLESPELMELILPTLRADFTVHETYVYSSEPPLSSPICAFGGLQDSRISRARLAAWRDQTSVSFKMEMFEGDHFFLHTAQPLLLQRLSQELNGIGMVHFPPKLS